MTEVIEDAVKTTMTIDGDPWLPVEVVVELSRMSTPNYVDINTMVPDPAADTSTKLDDLIDTTFELHADNQLISNRDTTSNEETLLFKGNLANISPKGDGAYEGIAYDPSQQPFASGGKDSGSLLNQRISVATPVEQYGNLFLPSTGTIYDSRGVRASKVVQKVVEKLGVEDYDIELKKGGVTRSGPSGSVTGGYDRKLVFDKTNPTIREALKNAREQTESEWWFDKSGTFHFGMPNPSKHALRYITDASDGLSTPPYQSVRVIGSGIASKEGLSRMPMEPERKIVAEAGIAFTTGDNPQPTPILGQTAEPVFTYRNGEISSQAQARSTARKLVEDLIEQQKKGKVVVSGFPEIEPLDAIVMPQAQDSSAANYSPDQPMGGYSYGVYKVRHKLNSSDGFKTEIHVSGPIDVTRVFVPPNGLSEPSIRPTGGPGPRPGGPGAGLETQ